ncbi:MAG TPA: deoxyribodipyrimidine photo-lyase [Thermotogota bacterium]|jgi:deoxyribodipyrimidine photo-lyase|nr:deoxyribodipyrimidine photo-lyase [Thermotogota bacterium]HNR64105.1 deoxyribodipyrimidine photo-lyase [Thermotogota bacterium]HNT96372.1 deoxyribodipyrimidine photo-lyase [Thermotogota bacterium]HPH11221.1 deoxyribodipyrimidine photo-lyase [Thermotogota bacterium]HPM21558.1 deoxyribodipyrimidine photo-lyase [Thermotogota bacterium]
MAVNLLWFRRDLRLEDNHALAYCTSQPIGFVPLFILDPDILDRQGLSQRRIDFLLQSLDRLKGLFAEQKKIFHILYGKPVSVFRELCRQNTIAAICMNRDYEPYALRRDADVEEMGTQIGVPVLVFKDSVLHEPQEITKENGDPYQVFTPYYRQWLRLEKEPPFSSGLWRSLTPFSIPSGLQPDSKYRVFPSPVKEISPEKQMDTFFKDKIQQYDTDRDIPSIEGTSRLSPYLRFGLVSVRTLYAKSMDVARDLPLEQRFRIESFIRQLAWRDFYVQIMYRFPYVENGAFQKKYDAIVWENNPEWFDAWKKGRTGFPLVDAGMRQLNAEGWMHNRLRMITASFLTKDLLIDWRWGAEYFQSQLLDHDLALNNGGWQWAASTGTDAQPWFRIFNPYEQSKKFDPEGNYIRKYIPELKNMDPALLHQPPKTVGGSKNRKSERLPADYPDPIVTHAERRLLALETYKRIGS